MQKAFCRYSRLVIRRVGGLEERAALGGHCGIVIRRVGGLEVHRRAFALQARVIRRVGGLEVVCFVYPPRRRLRR